MSLLFTLEDLLKLGVYPRDRWFQGDDDDDDDDDDDSGGGGGGDDDDDDDDDSGGGGGGGGDDDDDSGGGGGFDPGDQGGDQGGGDQGNDQGGFDYGSPSFDWGNGNDTNGDSGWQATQDYEENGRTIRKYTDATGTDYFQDIGPWQSQDSQDSGFNYGDRQREESGFRQQQLPNVDQDVQDLHDFYHPHILSQYENDPIRKNWTDGLASDGTRFDQQDERTQRMFADAYGEDAAKAWAEERSRQIHDQFSSTGVVGVTQRPEPVFRPQPVVTEAERTAPAAPQTLFGLAPPTNPDGSPTQYTVVAPGDPGYNRGDSAVPPYVPPATTGPEPAPPDRAETRPPPEVTPATTTTPPTAPVEVHPAVQAAADAVARSGGSPDDIAAAAVAATRNLSSESPETQRQFQQAYGPNADAVWRQQHAQELALNRALYGTEEPRAGTPQTGTIPGLGDVGPAPDRTIGRAQPAPWNRPVTTPGAAGVAPSAVYPGLTPGAVSAVTSAFDAQVGRLTRPPEAAPPSAIYNGLTPSQVSAVTSTTQGLISDILARPPETAQPPVTAPEPIRGAVPSVSAPLPGPVEGLPAPGVPSPPPVLAPWPNQGPPPLTAGQAATFERGGVNPATGEPITASPVTAVVIEDDNGDPRQIPIDVWNATDPDTRNAYPIVGVMRSPQLQPGPAVASAPSDVIGPGGERPEDILTIRNGLGQIKQEPRWAWDQRGPQGQAVWEVINAEGAPTQTMREAGFSPASAQIDTSVRTAAGLPPAINPVTGEPTGLAPLPVNGRGPAGPLQDPFGMLVQRAAEAQGANDVEGFGRNVAAGIASREAWAEPYANDLARAAWYHESKGLEGGPENAPASYIEDWKGAFRAGDTNVPGVREVSAELVSRGVAPPSVQASAAPSAPPVQANLTKYTPPGSAVVGAQLVPDQYRDRAFTGLAGWDPNATCGVTAGVGMARAVGLTVSPGEAFALARQAGYTSAGGMNGTANMVKYLDSLGVPNLGVQRADQARIDAELAAGRPVVIDTAGSSTIPSGHYFTIAARTDDGRYVVSGSGTALNGGDTVMSRQRMEQLTGSWRNAVYLDPARVPQGRQQAAPAQPTMVAARPTVRMQSTEQEAPSEVATAEAQPPAEMAPQVRDAGLPDRLDTSSRAAALNQLAPALDEAERVSGIPAESLAAIIIAENGAGQSGLAATGNNLFSIQRSNAEGPYQSGSYGPDPRWGTYKNPIDSINHFLKLISTTPRYKDAWANRRDPEKFVQGLIKGSYIVDEPGHPASKWQAEMADYRRQYHRAIGR